MRHWFLFGSILAAASAYAYPGQPVVDGLPIRATAAATSGTFIAVGVNTIVEVNGQNKTCTSASDIVMFDLGSKTLDNLSVKVWRAKPGFAPFPQGYCTLSGTPTGGAEFVTGVGSCYIRSMNDGSMESYGVTLKCNWEPYGGTCKVKEVGESVPSIFSATASA